MTEARLVTRFHAGKRVTPANALTVSRILLAPPLFWLVLLANETRGASWGALALGFAVGMSDHYDGTLARRQGTTRSGAFLDPLADKVVVIGCMVCLVIVDRFWWLPVAIIAARELGMTAMRSRFARRGLAIPARRSAKTKTLVQFIALAIAVMPPLKNTQVPSVVALWIAVAMTLYSGWQYIRDGQRGATTAGAL